jgi:hypothetical protein
VLAAVFALSLAASPTAQVQPTPPPVAHTSALGAPQADVLQDGTVVATFVATGDLRGLVTLTLRPADGSAYAGEWAFKVAHADNTDPITGEDEESHPHDDGDEDAPHTSYLRLIDRGSLSGTVSNAVVTFDTRGALVDLSAAVSIKQGTLEFAGASGSGQLTLSGFNLIF